MFFSTICLCTAAGFALRTVAGRGFSAKVHSASQTDDGRNVLTLSNLEIAAR